MILHEKKEGNIFMNICKQTLSHNLNLVHMRTSSLVPKPITTVIGLGMLVNRHVIEKQEIGITIHKGLEIWL